MSVLPKPKPPPPRRYYQGHYCEVCGWWRYGEGAKFTDSFVVHVRKQCIGRLHSIREFLTGKQMQAHLEALSHGQLP